MHSSPSSNASPPVPSCSRNALLSIQRASSAAREFDSAYNLRNVERELSIPLFRGNEVVLESTAPCRVSSNSYYNEFVLQNLRVTRELVDASDPDSILAYKRKQRVADRLQDQPGAYSVKYCVKGLVDSEHGPLAASELVLETKILMNLSPSHPNLLQVFAANGDGIDAFLESGRKGFFLLVERLSETLDQKMECWRQHRIERKDKADPTVTTKPTSPTTLTERLEVANDICSALVFLASRELVYYLRPAKVGFDARSGRLKLCEFGEARQEGLECPSPTILNASSRAVFPYTAPEVLARHPAPATLSSDVYSFGIVLWELTTLQRPFDGLSRKDYCKLVVEHQKRPTVEANAAWPRDVSKLMEQCWDPNFRPTIKAVQDVLETILLFNDDGGVHAKDTAKSSNTATREKDVNTSHDATGSSPTARARRPSKVSSVDQHLRRSTKDSHSPKSSGASVATHSTFRTKGDYSAFTQGNASPRHNQVQRQRLIRQRSVSRGPVSVRGEPRGDESVADEARSVCGGPREASNVKVPRPRRLSMEIPRSTVKDTSVQRSRSMNDEDAAVLKRVVSQLPPPERRRESNGPTPMEVDSDESSKQTTPTLPSSESSPEPALVSPVQRKPRSPRRSSYHGSLVSGEESPPSVSPMPRGTSARVPSRNNHLPRRVSRTQSLRRLVQGEGFPTPEVGPSPNQDEATSRKMYSSPRRSSMGTVDLSSFKAASVSPNSGFSLDNIPQVPSPVPVPALAQRVSTRRSSLAASPSKPQFLGVSRYRSNDSLQSLQTSSKFPRLVSDPHQVAAAATFVVDSPSHAGGTSATSTSPRRRMVQRSSSSRDVPAMSGRTPRRPSFVSEAAGVGRSPLVRSDSLTFRVSPSSDRKLGPGAESRDCNEAGTRLGASPAGPPAGVRRSPPNRRPSYASADGTTKAYAKPRAPTKRESFSSKLRAEMAEERLLQLQPQPQPQPQPHHQPHHPRPKGSSVARRSSKFVANET